VKGSGSYQRKWRHCFILCGEGYGKHYYAHLFFYSEMACWLIKLTFYAPFITKFDISEMLFAVNLLAGTKQTKSNTTKKVANTT